ncbi:MAG: hypothetical protein PQJ60_02085 [Spirochaetales bacterium]|nr:hypothetical protein [Spirochaetales bacterium]
MNKIITITLFSLFLTFSLTAQSFYFDIGGGLGQSTTTLDGEELSDYFGSSSTDVYAMDVSTRIGYGPVAQLPLYVVAEVESIIHSVYIDGTTFDFTSYLIGPGVVFYPVPFIQMGASLGYSFTDNSSRDYTMYDSRFGYAVNCSLAVEYSTIYLLGLKYAYSSNTLDTLDIKQTSSQVTVFAKIVIRQKGISSVYY